MAASPRPFDRAGLRARLLAMLQPHMAKVAQDGIFLGCQGMWEG